MADKAGAPPWAAASRGPVWVVSGSARAGAEKGDDSDDSDEGGEGGGCRGALGWEGGSWGAVRPPPPPRGSSSWAMGCSCKGGGRHGCDVLCSLSALLYPHPIKASQVWGQFCGLVWTRTTPERIKGWG